MVLGRSRSSDSLETSGGGRHHLRDSALIACTELLLGPGDGMMTSTASSAAVAAALTVDLAAAVATGSVPTSSANQELVVDNGVLVELSTQSGDSAVGEGRHMAHHWMRSDVAATIRTIHNNKKATIRQHYYPEGISPD